MLEIEAKSALVRSGIPGVDWVINPYLGCAHGCRYCYASFMRRHSAANQESRWGTFVEVKVNLPAVLREELRTRRRTGEAFLSSVCDPYQPAERRYRLTRECILLLREYGWEISILTRSPLVTRDIAILATCLGASVGVSIPTDDDRVRRATEPGAPPIGARIATLRKLREAGIATWAFLAPILPMNPARLHEMVAPVVDSVMVDRLNYRNLAAGVFRANGWEHALTDEYQDETAETLRRLFGSAIRKEGG